MEETGITHPCPSGKPNHEGIFAFRKDRWSLYRCRACGHLWTDPVPTEDELANFYTEGYFQGDASRRGYTDYEREKERTPSEFTWYLDHIARHRAANGRLLDIGAATGFFVRMANERGWQGSGVELSAHAAGVAARNGLDVVQGTLEQHSGRFHGVDVVTMWDVVEHLRDPFSFFRLLRSVVAPDGLIMFATPQSDSVFARLLGSWWTLVAPPQHIHYFSLSSIRACMDDAGFEIVDIAWRGKDFTISYVIHFAMGWLGVEWKWLKRLSTWGPFTRWRIRINPRDMMIVTAKPK